MSEIVTLTGMCKRSVQHVIREFKDSGETHTPVPKAKTGRPKLISRRMDKVLNRQVSHNPRSTARELKETNDITQICLAMCQYVALSNFSMMIGEECYR